MTTKPSLTENSRYIPVTTSLENEMLADIGVSSFDDLISNLPDDLKQPFEMPVGPALSEQESTRLMEEMAALNRPAGKEISFLGSGNYDHFIPSAIPALVMRSEFYTAYTPYQAEVSQGTLQAMYEYQSMLCEISDMDVANASLYDGASAVAEACLMAGNSTRKSRIVLGAGLCANYRQVVETYLQHSGLVLDYLNDKNGRLDIDELAQLDFSDVAAVVVQSPNRYGLIEDWSAVGDLCQRHPAFFIAVGDPLASGMFTTPGECSADIYCGEGQGLGNPMSFGGPGLGLFATREKHVRKMPGRIIGATEDVEGKPGFVLALQTREQHIRRERATSNICTNQGLMALSTAVYLSLVGQAGYKRIAELCFQKSHYCGDEIAGISGFSLAHDRGYFKEFVVRCPVPAKDLIVAALDSDLLIGSSLPSDSNLLRLAVTEKRTRADIDKLIEFLKGYSQ